MCKSFIPGTWDLTKTCYQCEQETTYLFADSRCKDCTRLTPDEVVGNVYATDSELMFVVYNLTTCVRMAAFTSYHGADIYRQEFDDGRQCIIEAVEEDEDLYYCINS